MIQVVLVRRRCCGAGCGIFTAGAVIGSKKFVNDVFDHSREYFGAKRMTGERKMRGVEEVEGEAIHVMRDLQKDVYGQ